MAHELRPMPKCICCGADVEIHPNDTSVSCSYCHTRMSVSRFTQEEKRVAEEIERLRAQGSAEHAALSAQIRNLTAAFHATLDGQLQELFRQGEEAQRRGDFDEAIAHYQKLLEKCPNESEVHWRIMLCRYGIEYVREASSGCALPTLTKMDIHSVMDDADFLAAKDHAPDESIRSYYIQEGKRINGILRDYQEIRGTQKPYDVFISVKQGDDHGHNTQDSQTAMKIWHMLDKRGFKVFNSAVSLENYSGVEYEPHIMHALSTAKVMIVVASGHKYMYSPWVRNEWRRFRYLKDNERTQRRLIGYILGSDKWDMHELGGLQIIRAAGHAAPMEEVLQSVTEAIKKSKPNRLPVIIAGGTVVAVAGIFALTGSGILSGNPEPTATPYIPALVQNIEETAAPTVMITETPTVEPTNKPTATPSPSPTPTSPPTPSPTPTPSLTPTPSPTPKPTPTSTPIPTATPNPTSSPTPMPTATPKPSPSPYVDRYALLLEHTAQGTPDPLISALQQEISSAISNSDISFSGNLASPSPSISASESTPTPSPTQYVPPKPIDDTRYIYADYEYALLEDGSVQITDYSGRTSQLAIPSEIDGRAVTSIGKRAFYACSSLTNVTIPDSVTFIGSAAFLDCINLTRISISTNVTTIRDSVFYNCNSLTDISIPDSVTSINDRAFSYCDNLTHISIPDSVVHIGGGAFSGTLLNADSVTISDNHPAFAFRNGVLFSKDGSQLLWYPDSLQASSYTVPEGVTFISDDSFSHCDNLTQIFLPDSITFIGDYAFYGCKNLMQLSIPHGITSIEDWTFAHCHNLTQITIPDSVTSIGENAFSHCPDSLIIIAPAGSYAEAYAKENGIATFTAAPTPTPTVVPTLRKGSKGEQVAALQRRLIELRYLYDTADGVFGQNTEAAVKRFQKAIGASQTGTADANLQAKLFSATAPTAPPTPKPTKAPTSKPTQANYTTLQAGNSSEAVASLQRRLKALGYFEGPVGGNYLTSTVNAVKLFQQEIGVTPDGIATPELQRRIFSSSAPYYSGDK